MAGPLDLAGLMVLAGRASLDRMALTTGSGPFAPGSSSSARLNFSLDDAPPHRLVFQPDPRRIRALVGGEVVLDTVRAHLLHESGLLPVVYAPEEDFSGGTWVESTTSTHCPFKGDAAYRSLQVGDTTVQDLQWRYPDPLARSSWLAGYAALDADQVDVWFVEDDRVVGHLRDPYHRVDAHISSRRAVVRRGDEVIAESDRPVLVFETGMPTKVYIPPADVRPGAVSSGSGKRTTCPYKGEATYWDVGPLADAAWSYETPLPDALRAQAHLCFDDSQEGLSVELG